MPHVVDDADDAEPEGRVGGSREADAFVEDPADVLITPRVGSVGWFDFHRAEEAIRLGEEATEKELPAISEAIAALSTPIVTNGGGK